jgi:hypothetical protein
LETICAQPSSSTQFLLLLLLLHAHHVPIGAYGMHVPIMIAVISQRNGCLHTAALLAPPACHSNNFKLTQQQSSMRFAGHSFMAVYKLRAAHCCTFIGPT